MNREEAIQWLTETRAAAGDGMMDKVYETEMMFSVAVGFKQINDIMTQIGLNDILQLQDAVTVSVKQVLPAIPDEDYLCKVADAIKENYGTNDLNCTACHHRVQIPAGNQVKGGQLMDCRNCRYRKHLAKIADVHIYFGDCDKYGTEFCEKMSGGTDHGSSDND